MLNINAYTEPLRSFLAAAMKDADYNWRDSEHESWESDEAPESSCIDENTLENAYEIFDRFHEQHRWVPFDFLDGGQVYMEIVYGDSDLNEDDKAWIHKKYPNGMPSAEIARTIYGDYRLFMEG